MKYFWMFFLLVFATFGWFATWLTMAILATASATIWFVHLYADETGNIDDGPWKAAGYLIFPGLFVAWMGAIAHGIVTLLRGGTVSLTFF